MPTSLDDWADRIGAWHRAIFPWAKLVHVMDKLDEEQREAVIAWSKGDIHATADELADCLICVLAAMSRERISPDTALAAKFPRVQAKYAAPQASPSDAEPELPL